MSRASRGRTWPAASSSRPTGGAWASSRYGRWRGTGRYRQSQYAGLTRLQLDEVGRERQLQRHEGAWRPEALAEGSVELAQAMVPQALVLARGG